MLGLNVLKEVLKLVMYAGKRRGANIIMTPKSVLNAKNTLRKTTQKNTKNKEKNGVIHRKRKHSTKLWYVLYVITVLKKYKKAQHEKSQTHQNNLKQKSETKEEEK